MGRRGSSASSRSTRGFGQVLDRDREPERRAAAPDPLRQLADRELLGELVEHAVLAGLRRVQQRQLDAAHGVADVEEAAGLPAAAVDGQRVADRRLDAEAVQRGAEDLVVVEAR